MSDERRKMNMKSCTGTVPKIKSRNNRSHTNDGDNSRSWTNNLSTDFHRLNLSDYLRNSRRNSPNFIATMNSVVDETAVPPRGALNGSLTPSSSTSRRNSSGAVPKCDNITKYPDKKQIEDKLSQIREYLQITTTLMSSMKNTDEQSNDEIENLSQMINDLKDSEQKLVNILDTMDEATAQINEIIEKNEQILENGVDGCHSESESAASYKNDLDLTNRELDAVREQQLSLLTLQQKAENRLRDARQAQEKMLSQASSSNQKLDKNFAQVDAAIRELEERTNRLNEPRSSSSNLQDNLLADVDSLHNQIIGLHNINEDRNQLIQVLDNRDQELRAQHIELQNKLSELQNKKHQVDQLVSQLQTLDDGNDDDDVNAQVKRIVTMKDQLSKLKDMLEIVKTTETVMQNTNGMSAEEQELACAICTKAENFLHKDADKKAHSSGQNDTNMVRYDNKQVNKTTGTAAAAGAAATASGSSSTGGAKPRVTNKLALRAELEAKKRELEDIMGKHKAGTSNLNHDVGVDNKSELSCSSNTFFDGVAGWAPVSCEHNRFDSSDRYSSDECPEDVNEYNQGYSLPLPNYSRVKHRSEPDYIHIQDTDRLSSITRTPDRNIRSNSVTTGCSRERPRSNSEQVNKTQVQKQLELIRSVCDSMLEQQHQHQQQQHHQQPPPPPSQQSSSSNVQLRNNLTPSPLYSEPRRFASPHPQPTNVLNVVNPLGDSPWLPTNNVMNQESSSNYQGWLATNTLQTQAFMLNTLNQCCQMLWLQQRELAALRSTVNQLQERLDNPSFDNQSHLASPLQPPNVNGVCTNNSGLVGVGGGGGGGSESRSSSNQYRSNQKTNQVSGACSMPNLNQYNVPVPNIDPNYHHPHPQHNNARLLDTCLNNANNIHNPDAINNMANIHNQAMQTQIWNGQALNNQIAPGNRANNYWDNFRSYSRQNLLSTKSNEGLQNLASSTTTTNNEQQQQQQQRTNPFTIMSSLSKSNSSQTSLETTPQRRTQFSSSSSGITPSVGVAATITPSIIGGGTTTGGGSGCLRRTDRPIPPDVLNVNHNIRKTNEHHQQQHLNCISNSSNSAGGGGGSSHGDNHQRNSNNNNNNSMENDSSYQMYINNAFGYNETCSNHSNISEEQIFKDCIPETTRRRNEWHEDQHEESYPKSKLFEELRENVYKEVVTLISANEARPHFLIQLFRDLQMISSDPLRLKILQSIQTIITHSLISSTHLNQQILDNASSSVNDQMLSDCFSLQSTVWSKTPNDPPSTTAQITQEANNADIQNALKEVIPYLNDHEDDIISHHFLTSLKQVLIDSDAFQETVRDAVFKKHFSNVLDEVLNQFVGKKVCDVKMVILQTITDLLQGELSFIQLIQDTCPDNCETVGDILPSSSSSSVPPHVNIFETNSQQQENQIQNGDLAEADQGRVEDDDTEEEGAVGGFWDQLEPGLILPTTTNQNNSEEVDVSTIQYQNSSEVQFSKQGLDQVPTRLPTKSRSNTPNKDRSSSRSDHHQEPF